MQKKENRKTQKNMETRNPYSNEYKKCRRELMTKYKKQWPVNCDKRTLLYSSHHAHTHTYARTNARCIPLINSVVHRGKVTGYPTLFNPIMLHLFYEVLVYL